MNPKRTLALLLLAVALAAAIPQAAQAYALQTRDLVFLVRVGTNSDGSPAFRVATSNDRGAERVFRLASGSTALEKTAAYYKYVQQMKNQALLEEAGRYGLSESDRRMAGNLLQSEPIYIEIREGGGGAFNDWKGTFTIRDSYGGAPIYAQSPRVVLPLGSSVVTGGDTALLEQTLVHEVGHGIMCKCHGIRNLPDSPYLSQSHSGGSVTDPQLAIIEGWAEFIGAYFTNRLTIANDPRNSISDNLYSYNSDGSPKNAQQLERTEGWVATVLWTLAARSGIQNALGKMTMVNIQTKPQSIRQLLDNMIRMFPSDAQAIRNTVARVSNGQIYLGGAGGGNGANSGYGLISQYESTVDRYVRLRYAYLSTASDYYGNERQRIAQAAQQESRKLQEIEWRLRQEVLSGRGSGDTLMRLQQQARGYERRYNEARRQLNGMPWYSRRERERLEAEAQALGEVLDRQVRLVNSLEQGPVYYSDGRRGGYSPGAPVDSKDAYKNLLKTLKSGDREEAGKALEGYREAASRKKVPDAR